MSLYSTYKVGDRVRRVGECTRGYGGMTGTVIEKFSHNIVVKIDEVSDRPEVYGTYCISMEAIKTMQHWELIDYNPLEVY